MRRLQGGNISHSRCFVADAKPTGDHSSDFAFSHYRGCTGKGFATWALKRQEASATEAQRINGSRRMVSSSSASASSRSTGKNQDGIAAKNLLLKAGMPFVLFSVLAAWVVSNALDGKLREMEASQGKVSKSIRQAKMEEEHEEMLERLNKIVAQDFDNTKRIKRPDEILEERRREREKRNAWHRRLYRWAVGDGRSTR